MQGMLNCANSDIDFLNTRITGNESQTYRCIPQNCLSLQWKYIKADQWSRTKRSKIKLEPFLLLQNCIYKNRYKNNRFTYIILKMFATISLIQFGATDWACSYKVLSCTLTLQKTVLLHTLWIWPRIFMAKHRILCI